MAAPQSAKSHSRTHGALVRHFGRSIVGTIDFIAPEIYDVAQIAVSLLLKQESPIQTGW